MYINQEELTKLIIKLFNKYCHYKDIVLNDLCIEINDFINIKGHINYYGINTIVDAIAKIETNDNIIIVINGVIKYGFINLDLNKVLQEWLKEYSIIKIEDDKIFINNDYINKLQLNDGIIKVELR